MMSAASKDFLDYCGDRKFHTILADPPWQFQNRTGKVAPEHHRLSRYTTMTLSEICSLPVSETVVDPAHDQIGLARQNPLSKQGKIDTVRGRTIDRMITARPDFMPQRSIQGQRMTTGALLGQRRHDHNIGYLGERGRQGLNSTGPNPIVIRNQDQRALTHGGGA